MGHPIFCKLASQALNVTDPASSRTLLVKTSRISICLKTPPRKKWGGHVYSSPPPGDSPLDGLSDNMAPPIFQPAIVLAVRDNDNLKSHKYVCITTYQPDTKSNPNPNPTTKQNQLWTLNTA